MQRLDDIAVFIKVIQTGSFTRAARQLAMPNTTVSAKVAALEKSLGVTLIHRTTRKLSATRLGESYFKKCLGALEEIQSATSDIASSQSVPQGLFRITSPVDIGQSILRPLLHDFLEIYPKVTVEMVLTNRFVDLVEEGIDLAVRAGFLRNSTLIARKFVEAPIGLWASPAYLQKHQRPHHPRDLSDHSFVKFSPMPSSVQLTNGKETFKLTPHGRLLVDDIETLKAYVVDGAGLGLLPQFLCKEEDERGILVNILPNWNNGVAKISFVYPPQKFASTNTQAFMRLALGK